MKIEKIDSYPPLTTDEQETILALNLGLNFAPGGYYRVIEAIIKGGYNY